MNLIIFIKEFVVKYELLEEDTASGLSDLVNERVEAGWLPLGTPFTAVVRRKYTNALTYLQAVILMEDQDENDTPAASGEVHGVGSTDLT